MSEHFFTLVLFWWIFPILVQCVFSSRDWFHCILVRTSIVFILVFSVLSHSTVFSTVPFYCAVFLSAHFYWQCSIIFCSAVFFSALLCWAGQDGHAPLREASGTPEARYHYCFLQSAELINRQECVSLSLSLCLCVCSYVGPWPLKLPSLVGSLIFPRVLLAYCKYRRSCSLPVCTQAHT